MSRRQFITCLIAWLLVASMVSVGCYRSSETYEVEITDYNPPPPDEQWLVDDQLSDKHPQFLPDLVDRRSLEEWEINQSEAVISLDVPLVKPDTESDLLTLYPSYTAALQARANVPSAGTMLPSVNMIDGKAKQFDDGLYAAIDQANYQGLEQQLHSLVDVVRQIHAAVPADHESAAFLAAGLQLAGLDVPVTNVSLRDQWLAEFNSNQVASKPIGFYTWSKTLEDTWRFMRFFQSPLAGKRTIIATDIAQALKQNQTLLSDYQRAMQLYSKLTNPYVCLTMLDIVNEENVDADLIEQMCQKRKLSRIGVALFPASTSREQMLFEKLFPLGLPPNTNLMRELVTRIRSGEVDLMPTPESGWYERQVYALETLLLPEKGKEHDKLLLTKAYKKRMLDAFKALVTKRRETHVRQLAAAKDTAMAPIRPGSIAPRLRVEPAPSYYLRTARSYAFLQNILEASLGADVLESLHGLKKDGIREPALGRELESMKNLFYGLYLVSAEDIGLKPELAEGEVKSTEDCYQRVVEWVIQLESDPDLAADTRVSVPIYVDADRNVTHVWLTPGVRLTKLDARFASPPSIRPKNVSDEWVKAEDSELATSNYLIAVDEFAEVELKGNVSLSREELREICDKAQTKEKIIAALEAH